MKAVNILSIISIVLFLFFAACDDDPVSSEDLSSDEVELMMEAFQNAGILGGPFMSLAGGMPQNNVANNVTALSDGHAQDFEQTVNCPDGGTATYQGSVTQGENHLSTQLNISLNGCSSSDGEENGWVFDGDLDYNMDFEGDEESFEMNGSQEGLIETSGYTEASCEMDITYSISGSQTGVSGQVNGSVCGKDASYAI